MAFVSLFFVYLVIILIIIFCSTGTAIALFIVSAVMKKRQLLKKQNAEMSGDYSYTPKKTYLVARVFGFICMLPLTLAVALILYAVIATSIEKHTSLSYNVLHANTSQVEKILNKGVSPNCTEKSNSPATNGEKTLLYRLTEGALKENLDYKDESIEQLHEETLEMMRLLIENGADVNCVSYREEENYYIHGYEDEYSIYKSSDQCGWTPLMSATYYADFDMIKLLVDNGADVNAVDYCGYNVIDIIADNLNDTNGYEILEYYLDKGVDPKNVTKFNQNALWLAERQYSGNYTPDNDKILMKLEQLTYN